MTLISIEEVGRLQCFITRIGYLLSRESVIRLWQGTSEKSSQQQEKQQTTTKDADKAGRMVTAAFLYKSDLLDKW